MVICIEITDDSHPSSQRVQPLIVNLAREISQIPFFRVKFEVLHTYDQVSTFIQNFTKNCHGWCLENNLKVNLIVECVFVSSIFRKL